MGSLGTDSKTQKTSKTQSVMRCGTIPTQQPRQYPDPRLQHPQVLVKKLGLPQDSFKVKPHLGFLYLVSHKENVTRGSRSVGKAQNCKQASTAHKSHLHQVSPSLLKLVQFGESAKNYNSSEKKKKGHKIAVE